MDPFFIKVLLSLITGMVWVVVSTYIAEKVSGKIGGLILGLPSTAAISLLFIGLTQGVPGALASSQIIPFSSGLYCFYYIAYLVLTKRGFTAGFFGSLVVWFIFAFLASAIPPHSLFISIVLWLFLITICIWWVTHNIHINHKIIPSNIKGIPLWIKAILTGTIISLIIIISKIAGPKWGGILATFPALATSTYLITIKSGSIEFTRLIAKNILISTTTTIGLYAILCYKLYPVFGIILGTIISYAGLLIISIPLYFLIFDKLEK